MIANIQRTIAAVLLLAWICATTVAIRSGRPGLTLLFPAFVALAYSAILALEFLWLRDSFDPEDSLRPPPSVLLRAWVAECGVGAQVFAGRQPFRSHAHVDMPAGHGDSAARGVLFVHGFFCNRGIWNPWLARFARSGRPFIAVDLEPVFGPIDAYVATIDAAARRLHAATGRKPIVVAHSMGGIAVRAWLSASADAGSFVHQVVTIATPHGGTSMARRSRAANAVQMMIGSEWLTALGAAEAALPRRRFTCFWGECDNIVFPVRAATLPDADNVRLEGTPHVAMVYHPKVFETVVALADEAD